MIHVILTFAIGQLAMHTSTSFNIYGSPSSLFSVAHLQPCDVRCANICVHCMYELFNFKYFCVGNVRDDTSNEIEVSDLRWGRESGG